MSGLETNLKNTRPRRHDLETEIENISKRPKPKRDRDRKKSRDPDQSRDLHHGFKPTLTFYVISQKLY